MVQITAMQFYFLNNITNEGQLIKTCFYETSGKIVQHLFGKCTEAIYCGKAPSAKCLWRPGTLPVDANIHYGFSRFAIELNEILPKERTKLPRTDTRFRPDQRSLEVFFVVDRYYPFHDKCKLNINKKTNHMLNFRKEKSLTLKI